MRVMEFVLDRLIGNTIWAFLDDITIFSDTKEDHIRDIRQVCQRLQNHIIRASPAKYKFFADRLPLLGHVIDDQGIHADPEKIRGIQDWHTPKSKNEFQTLIGVVIYHAQFLPHLATLSARLSHLLSQSEFEWRPLHEEAFQPIRTLTKSITTLRLIDYQSPHPIYFFTDASKVEAEAWISQGSSPEKAHPAAFHSQKFTTSQLHYPVHELKLLAVVDAVQSFHPQLYGTRFTVVTDNKALLYSLSQTNLPFRLTRWRMYLQSHDFDIIHIPGKDADAQSRVYEEREASTEMTLVDLTKKKNLKSPYSAMTNNTRHNLGLAHRINPHIAQSFFSTTHLNPFSVPQYLSMWNTEDVTVSDSPQDNENNNRPGPIEQQLVQMATTLEQGIEAMQSGPASIQGEPIDRSETTILIQGAQSQLATLAARIHSLSRYMESSLRLNAITNCFGTIHDSITRLESIALASSGDDTAPSSSSSSPSPDELVRFVMSTGHRAKHWTACVWDECETHMERKDRHYYPSGTRHIPASSPLYSASCFITPHHPKADSKTDGLSLLPLPAMMDTQSSTL